jgi:hypothetical protein
MPKRQQDQTGFPPFEGFEAPRSNFFRLPNNWTDLTASMSSIAELKVVEYVLRHTWGFQEFGIKKRITTDEFMNGRRHVDGTRIDKGTGLSKQSVITGIQLALEHGFLEEEVDNTDRARIKKFYSVRMRDENSDVKNFDIGVKDLDSRGTNFGHRTEKETRERKNSNFRMTNKEKIGEGFHKPQPLNVGGASYSEGESEEQGVKPIPRGTPNQSGEEAKQSKYRNSGKGVSQEEMEVEPEKRRGGFEKVGAALPPRPRRRAEYSEERQALTEYITDFSREFGDKAPLKSSVTRAYNLLTRSGVTLSAFISHMYEARAITKERSSSIKNKGEKMGYFFRVLEDRLGLKDGEEEGRFIRPS